MVVSRPPKTYPTRYWHRLEDGRVQCDVCPRFCKLHEGQRGLCYVRGCEAGEVVLYSYGRSSGFCIDPIEKKPLNHFYPGSAVLSLGTAGCNLACKFCQNWDISKSREMDTLAAEAMPDAIAEAAVKHGCKSVAFTYNDPVIFLEYAMDTADACHALGVNTVAVSAGYMNDQAREAFYSKIDAVNIDLKAFSEGFYKKLCGGQLLNVLETLEYIHHQTQCWLEVTTLLIPGENDSDTEIHHLTDWLVEKLGVDVPLHFSAFYPQWKMRDTPSTPPATLIRAREIALGKGLNYVYTGNIHFPQGDSTYCPSCGELVVGRDGYQLGRWQLDAYGRCRQCGIAIAGCYSREGPENWGSRRQVIQVP